MHVKKKQGCGNPSHKKRSYPALTSSVRGRNDRVPHLLIFDNEVLSTKVLF